MAIHHAEQGKVVDLNTISRGETAAIVKTDRFEVIRLVVEPDKPIPPHQVDGPITVHCLDGTCEFMVGEETRPMVPGSWLYLDGGTSHAVEALERSVLLITIIF